MLTGPEFPGSQKFFPFPIFVQKSAATLSLTAYLLGEQLCQISSWSTLEWQSCGHFWTGCPYSL